MRDVIEVDVWSVVVYAWVEVDEWVAVFEDKVLKVLVADRDEDEEGARLDVVEEDKLIASVLGLVTVILIAVSYLIVGVEVSVL